jgi:predicted protein tyrosine phosphatase
MGRDEVANVMSRLPYRLSVCPKRLVDDYRGEGVTHLLSLEDPGTPKGTPAWFKGIHRQHHFHDVESVQEAESLNAVPPTEAQVALILAFGEECLKSIGKSPVHLLVHCFAGASRSPAACYVLAARALGRGHAAEALQLVLKLQPEAFPNALIVRHADKLLGFEGELMGALKPLRREFNDAVNEWIQSKKDGSA